MPKEQDLCRAVAMAADQPVLLRRAIDAYKKESHLLSSIEKELLQDAEVYLKDMQKIETDYKALLNELYALSDLEILDIGYDD